MSKYDVNKFKNVTVALNTPFDKNGDVDLEATKAVVNYFCNKGIKQMYVCGSTGEGFLLDTEERTAVTEFKAAEDAVKERINKLLNVKGTKTVDSFHRELGLIMWDDCGMARTEESLMRAIERIPQLRKEFWENVLVTGTAEGINAELEKACRVADFLEFAQLLCYDALNRQESCGAHFRVEYQLPDGEAKRNDEEYAYVAAWEYAGVDELPILHKEPLTFDNVHLAIRSYK